jgi:hypothetical protein
MRIHGRKSIVGCGKIERAGVIGGMVRKYEKFFSRLKLCG